MAVRKQNVHIKTLYACARRNNALTLWNSSDKAWLQSLNTDSYCNTEHNWLPKTLSAIFTNHHTFSTITCVHWRSETLH